MKWWPHDNAVELGRSSVTRLTATVLLLRSNSVYVFPFGDVSADDLWTVELTYKVDFRRDRAQTFLEVVDASGSRAGRDVLFGGGASRRIPLFEHNVSAASVLPDGSLQLELPRTRPLPPPAGLPPR